MKSPARTLGRTVWLARLPRPSSNSISPARRLVSGADGQKRTSREGGRPPWLRRWPAQQPGRARPLWLPTQNTLQACEVCRCWQKRGPCAPGSPPLQSHTEGLQGRPQTRLPPGFTRVGGTWHLSCGRQTARAPCPALALTLPPARIPTHGGCWGAGAGGHTADQGQAQSHPWRLPCSRRPPIVPPTNADGSH